jgi:hypothetical protein
MYACMQPYKTIPMNAHYLRDENCWLFWEKNNHYHVTSKIGIFPNIIRK